jgi:hypothetical protein
VILGFFLLKEALHWQKIYRRNIISVFVLQKELRAGMAVER